MNAIKAYLHKLKPAFDIWQMGAAIMIVRGISLSSFVFALAGACAVMTMTIHFQNGYVMIIPEYFPHLYKAVPAWLGR